MRRSGAKRSGTSRSPTRHGPHRRYARVLARSIYSPLMRGLAPTIALLGAWSVFVFQKKLTITANGLGFLASPIGLLLAFRVNSCVSRFHAARTWGKMTFACRDVASTLCLLAMKSTPRRRRGAVHSWRPTPGARNRVDVPRGSSTSSAYFAKRGGLHKSVEGAQARFDVSIIGPQGDDRLPLGHHVEGVVSFDLGPEFVVRGHRTTHLDTLGADVHETLSTGFVGVVVFTPMRSHEGRLLDGAEAGPRRRVGGVLFLASMQIGLQNSRSSSCPVHKLALWGWTARRLANHNTHGHHLPKHPGAQPAFGGGVGGGAGVVDASNAASRAARAPSARACAGAATARIRRSAARASLSCTVSASSSSGKRLWPQTRRRGPPRARAAPSRRRPWPSWPPRARLRGGSSPLRGLEELGGLLRGLLEALAHGLKRLRAARGLLLRLVARRARRVALRRSRARGLGLVEQALAPRQACRRRSASRLPSLVRRRARSPPHRARIASSRALAAASRSRCAWSR